MLLFRWFSLAAEQVDKNLGRCGNACDHISQHHGAAKVVTDIHLCQCLTDIRPQGSEIETELIGVRVSSH